MQNSRVLSRNLQIAYLDLLLSKLALQQSLEETAARTNGSCNQRQNGSVQTSFSLLNQRQQQKSPTDLNKQHPMNGIPHSLIRAEQPIHPINKIKIHQKNHFQNYDLIFDKSEDFVAVAVSRPPTDTARDLDRTIQSYTGWFTEYIKKQQGVVGKKQQLAFVSWFKFHSQGLLNPHLKKYKHQQQLQQ